MVDQKLKKQAIDLLIRLIETPSISGSENETAEIVINFFQSHDIPAFRKHNNVWARNGHFDPRKPTLLLNSHHDTVKPSAGWTVAPYKAHVSAGKIIGLGSNDAGASLVALLAVFTYFYNRSDLFYNLVIVASAEEETSGAKGISSVLPDLTTVDMAIVGEPTGMQMAIAEKGLIVMHLLAKGVAGHAARRNGVNAIEKAIADIQWFHSFQFPKVSEQLGPVRMTVTGIEAGIQHNIIPERCTFMVDIRSTDVYTNKEIIENIQRHIASEIIRCSENLNPSSIAKDHLIVKAAKSLGIPLFASPTLSDQAQIPAPSVKIGPGLSERSHTADEFVLIDEIHKGIDTYQELLEKILSGKKFYEKE